MDSTPATEVAPTPRRRRPRRVGSVAGKAARPQSLHAATFCCDAGSNGCRGEPENQAPIKCMETSLRAARTFSAREAEKFPFGSSCSGSSGERRAVAVVAPRFEAVSRLWVLTGLKHQPPVFSRLPVQHGKGGSSQTASGLCLVRHSTCLKLASLVEINPCFLVQNFLGFWALQKRPFSSCESTAISFLA